LTEERLTPKNQTKKKVKKNRKIAGTPIFLLFASPPIVPQEPFKGAHVPVDKKILVWERGSNQRPQKVGHVKKGFLLSKTHASNFSAGRGAQTCSPGNFVAGVRKKKGGPLLVTESPNQKSSGLGGRKLGVQNVEE